MPEPNPQRSRAIVLAVTLAVLAVVLAWQFMTPTAGPAAGPSNPARDQRRPATATAGANGPLDVRLEALKQAPPQPAGDNRNPFRFYVKPPPPPPPRPVTPATAPAPPRVPQVGEPGYVPPPPPPIPLKFIGTAEQGRKKVAIFVFTDGRGLPMYAAEGELVAGQYRVVRIGLESVVMRYANGSGEQTIPMRGGL